MATDSMPILYKSAGSGKLVSEFGIDQNLGCEWKYNVFVMIDDEMELIVRTVIIRGFR